MARKVLGMARNAVGPRGSRRRRWAIVMSPVIALILSVAVVLAVHDAGVFELEGDAITSSFHDWDQVYADFNNGNTLLTGAANVSFGTDGSGSASIFTGGGSKDHIDINQWSWKNSGGLPDKDNLTHAFAARYSFPPGHGLNCPPGGPLDRCELLYFGSDRFDNSGDAQQGFWFLQSQAGLKWDSNGDGEVTAADADCPISIGGGTGFCKPDGTAALHTDGDMLLISHFSNGGDVSTIEVFFWSDPDGPGGNPGEIVAGPSSNAALCGASSSDDFCGIVNPTNGTATGGWSFTDKDGNSTYLQGEFFEAGVNLARLGVADRCFSTLIAESRSSTSITATLKDFVLAPLGSCETDLATTASLNAAGTDIGSGNGPLSGTASSGTDTAVLTVSGISTWSGTLNFYLCGPLASVNNVCDANGVLVTSKTVSNASPPADFVSGSATLTSAGRYCWFTSFTPDADSAERGVQSAEHAGTPGEGNLECFTVRGAVPTLDTQAPAGSVTFGSAVQDNATLSGLAKEPGSNGGNATYPTINATNGAFGGSIQFTLVGPIVVGPPPVAGCTATPTGTGTNPQSLPVDGNAGNATYGPVSFTPNVSGTYAWKATYSNPQAVNNTGTVSHNGNCTDTDENVVVEQIPTAISTAPFGYPQDTASISSTSGNLPTGGTVVFKLFSSLSSCQADTGAVYSETKTNVVVGAVTQVTGITTNNTTFRIDSANQGTYFWSVLYSPGSTTHTGRRSACAESTAMTHTNDAGPGTVVPNP